MVHREETALVTGAGRGLGRRTAVELARSGWKVALNSRSRSSLEDTAGEIEALGGECLVAEGDVSDPQQMAAVVERTAESLSPVTVLVNNAARIGPPRFLEDADPASWSETLAVNLHGPQALCREVLPLMRKQERGRVINVVSGLAWMAFPRFNAYCTSKAALLQMTQCLAEELKQDPVQVMALDPGVMDTGMQADIRSLDPERLGPVREQFQEMRNKGMLRDPGDVAELVVALAGRDAEQDSGETFALRDLEKLRSAGR
jgi:NAD(P)-dependent dehydrogenase (short-subunit alcohol dehydrogenase family)